jgi:hypothetical protein
MTAAPAASARIRIVCANGVISAATREVAMTGILDTIKDWFHSGERDAKAAADGLEPVSVPAAGTGDDVETSTNAQVEGAAGQPWPENE